MKYWLIPVLLCLGGAQAQAQRFLNGFISVSPSFIGVNINNPLLAATAGVQFGRDNNLDVQQNSLVNFVGVHQVSLAKPGSSQSNTAGVTQIGNQSYTGLGQHIETLPVLPSFGAP
jgi:hypothetical protein